MLINAIDAATFAKANSAITWLKFAVPVVIATTFISSRFDVANFSSTAEFAPYGWHGIFSAVSTGGIVFALIGFRHAVDMAGETRNPSWNGPLAFYFLFVNPSVYLSLIASDIHWCVGPKRIEKWMEERRSGARARSLGGTFGHTRNQLVDGLYLRGSVDWTSRRCLGGNRFQCEVGLGLGSNSVLANPFPASFQAWDPGECTVTKFHPRSAFVDAVDL